MLEPMWSKIFMKIDSSKTHDEILWLTHLQKQKHKKVNTQ